MGRNLTIGQTARTRNPLETYGDGCTITMPTECECSPLTKTMETPPSARINLTEETTAMEEKVSRKSHTNWQTHARLIITNWTPTHLLAAYLAIPEEALRCGLGVVWF
jgi:hypothetical protein